MIVIESSTLVVVSADEVGAVISISTPVYPFSANIPDQSAHPASSPSPPLTSSGVSRARMKTSGNGDSRVAAGEGCRQRYRVQVEADAEDDGRVEGSEKPSKEAVRGRRGRKKDMVTIAADIYSVWT